MALLMIDISLPGLVLWGIGTIAAYYVLLPLFISCGHCVLLYCWRSPKAITSDLRRRIRRTSLQNFAGALVLTITVGLMLAANVPQGPGPEYGSPPPEMDPYDFQDDDAHFATLGLSPGATWAEVQKAYHELALEWHPDKHPPSKHIYVKTVFLQITDAYEHLRRKQNRRRRPS